MDKSRMSASKIAVMAGFALTCFGLLLYLWLAFGGPIPLKPKGYRFQLAFADAATLADQADVRIAGVSVGKVVDRRRAPEGNATLATVQLDERFAPIRTDARAMLRTKTLLGETYIELTAGTRGSPALREGARLADARVADQVDFDEFLRTFDAPTRREFRRWQESLAEATRGRSRDLNDALGNLDDFAASGGDLVRILGRRRQALSQLISETGTTFAAINRDTEALRTLITRNRQVFDSLAAESDSLAETFRILPTFQREARLTMSRLGDFAVDAEPLVRDLEPVLADAVPTLRDVRALAPPLRSFFGDLDTLVAAGRTGLPALSQVLRGLDPTLAALGPFLQQINPILEYLELSQPTISDFLNTGPAALNLKLPVAPGNKSLGHALPQLIMVGSESIPQTGTDPDDRGNAYLKPGALRMDRYRDGFFTLPSWLCPAGERKADEEVPGCFVQEPIKFGGPPDRRFPHVDEAERGGVTFGRGG